MSGLQTASVSHTLPTLSALSHAVHRRAPAVIGGDCLDPESWMAEPPTIGSGTASCCRQGQKHDQPTTPSPQTDPGHHRLLFFLFFFFNKSWPLL